MIKIATGTKAMTKWFVPFVACASALVGVAMTFAYYCVPKLNSSQAISVLVPFQVRVEPIFGTPGAFANRDAAMSAAPLNAILYGLVGLVLAMSVDVAAQHRAASRRGGRRAELLPG